MHGLIPAPELFGAQAAKTPGAVAVRDGDRCLGYAELDALSARFAASLTARGIGRGDLVAVILDRSAELVTAILAVLRSGAAYVPVSPEDPTERVGHLLDDAHPSLVITSSRHAKDLPALDGRAVHLVDEPLGAAGDPDTPVPRIEPRDAAYVIYTSGSTGRPKGVVIEHAALSAYLQYATGHYAGLAERALLHSSVSFDMAVTSLYGPLLTGGTVDVVDLREIGASPVHSAENAGPAFLKATPSHLALLRALPAFASPTAELVVGGEALTTAQLDPWWAEHPEVTVVNEYGPTEATVGCCVYRATREQAAAEAGPHVPIGRAVPGIRLSVLDERLRPVAPGATGELYIAGDQLARGYLGRPAATAAGFVADPLGRPGERLYRTGDLVRERADGNLEFLGRADDQIKVNGYRIEPAEIQSVLTGHGGVTEALVTVRGREAGAPKLTAYVVPSDGGGPLDAEELRVFAAARLPAHMVPVGFVPLDALPLTPNGKVDQDALPDPAPVEVAPESGPTSQEEQTLCRLAAELAGVASLGPDDDFFRLGGSSIAAARLVTRARREGVAVDLQTVLKERTIRRILARATGTHGNP
ncbi:non-ribosomal peptide synthetase [Streptomyces sp. NBC_01257]|uniref:non-ribosomal peptide synthetase n=1 Tax=Streptomyces sp. NBC_01257 TaxID=2903799 RepID=UPI002DD7B9CB|nr:non-ribosomal peptide synthetase [Streptomyces sp. NBC_01257]WRZ63444.1 non-ribosomal peptide synthetase [Streptomyces sp. NBC_01257]